MAIQQRRDCVCGEGESGECNPRPREGQRVEALAASRRRPAAEREGRLCCVCEGGCRLRSSCGRRPEQMAEEWRLWSHRRQRRRWLPQPLRRPSSSAALADRWAASSTADDGGGGGGSGGVFVSWLPRSVRMADTHLARARIAVVKSLSTETTNAKRRRRKSPRARRRRRTNTSGPIPSSRRSTIRAI
ncbi:hypothetical protein DAI22_07g281100 [Oryza sativa Japonica Group]|nr:hypothetical protein DAI22_07g281100 [Oryza sativa Japonica Group]